MKKILVAEDDTFLANAYRVKLSKSGYDVKVVANGDLVIQSLEEYVPDLLILDLLMPVKDGFATLTEIRKNEKWSTKTVV
jgi:two-component system response regulator VicR